MVALTRPVNQTEWAGHIVVFVAAADFTVLLGVSVQRDELTVLFVPILRAT